MKKKLLFLITVMCLLFTIVGCANEADSEKEQNKFNSTTTAEGVDEVESISTTGGIDGPESIKIEVKKQFN